MRLSVNTAQDIPDHFIAETPAKEISLELRALLEICRIRVESALPDNRADCLRFHVGTLFYACYSGTVRTDIIRNSFFFHDSKSFSQLLTFCFLFLYSGTAAVIYIISKTFRTLSMRKGT